jgi:hypothetical protein
MTRRSSAVRMRRYGASNNACRQKWSKKRRPHLGSKDAKNTLLRLTWRNVQSLHWLSDFRPTPSERPGSPSIFVQRFEKPFFFQPSRIVKSMKRCGSAVLAAGAYAVARSRLHVLYRRALNAQHVLACIA